MKKSLPDSQKTVLIVEDDALLAKNLTTLFQDAGLTVLQAGDGAIGLQTAVEKKPDIILLDIVLPNMDGLTMLKKLRQEHQALKIPVVLLTNLEIDDAIMSNLIANEPSYYLAKKDWHLKDILRIVKSSLVKPQLKSND